MQWEIVLIHQQINKIFCPLLLDMFLPDAEDIESSALIVRSCERVLVVTVALAVIKTHEATLLEDMVSSDDLNQLGVRRNAHKCCVLFHLLKFLLELVLKVLLSFEGLKFTARLPLCHP